MPNKSRLGSCVEHPPVLHNGHMFLLKKILTALILPPTGPMLLAAFGLLLARRRPRIGRAVASLAVAALLLMTLPVVGDTVLRGLETYPPVATEKLKEADAIVILGGGTYYAAPEYGGDTVAAISLVRCRYGARLARASGLPVLVTGGVVFAGRPEARSMEALLRDEFGVPVAFVEEASRDTRENAEFSARLLKAAGLTRVVLVTHAFHLPRAVPLFEAEGLTVIPAPTAFTTDSGNPWAQLLPSTDALRNMGYFLHEWLGSRFA
jgi:uncharacterized SAM-binding protein YcdF (DUF218 family)